MSSFVLFLEYLNTDVGVFLERRRRRTKWFLLKNFYFILFFLYDLAILVLEIKKMSENCENTFSLFPKQVSPDLGKNK